MGFWKKKEQNDVNKPVINPGLKNAFKKFNLNKSEISLNAVVNEIKAATFLVLIYKDGIIKTDKGDNKITVEKGSKIQFLDTYDQDGKRYLPILTDWNEVDAWLRTRENIAGWMMTTKEIFDFVIKQNSFTGIVINPVTDRWNMTKEQIELFVKELY